ncbi:MAG: monovalent cation/H+ antiporter subunit D family protein [Hyphomicrobiaceae bacterium]|nr:monovalent cation/H+ antiporter subunit D family protein [Hyphomicrobiaceae bacterium]MCC0008102.1 monovalent cation/H+ antiporter subunit D family protein [Hyphomicrobiaceae bacterium]
MIAAQPETLVQLAILIPLAAAALIPLFHRAPNLRETVTLVSAAALALIVWSLYGPVMAGARPELNGPEMVPGIRVALKVEPLGLVYALVASTLWIVNSIYSIGYMRGHDEPRQTSFYVCFAIAIASALAIAFAGNLVTLFLAYEVLTISTYPLVTHKASDEARRSGRKYLLLLIGTSMVLLLPAIIITAAVAGTADFTTGGILAGKLSPLLMTGLLALYVFGIGKAAVMPVHFWLPAAMVAPTPVSALLHAVAVVKAGVFSILKVVVYIFGIDTLTNSGAVDKLIWIPAATILIASLIAMTKDNLKARLAYSTVSQLSYIVTGALLATSLGVIGSGMHIAMHAVGKITLFFCAGAIYVAAHKTEVSELTGLGRAMPITFAAFTIGTLSIIGLPPFGGTWSKWYLALGAIEADKLAVVAILMISSLLNIAYLLPIPFRAFFGRPPASAGAAAAHGHKHGHGHAHGDGKIHEAPTACLIAISATALGCIALFVYPDFLLDLLKQIPLR